MFLIAFSFEQELSNSAPLCLAGGSALTTLVSTEVYLLTNLLFAPPTASCLRIVSKRRDRMRRGEGLFCLSKGVRAPPPPKLYNSEDFP